MREVFIKPPAEANCDEHIVWKLKKCAYGLNDAAREWYFTMKNFLLKLGCVQIKTDPSAFCWYQSNELSGVFVMHVDDFLWGGTKLFEKEVICKIRSHFKVGEQNNLAFKYIGINMKQNLSEDVKLDQNAYVESIKPIPIAAARAMKKDEYCNKVEFDQYRGLVGQLGWLCTNSRPDISFDVLELSCKNSQPKIEDIIQANKCLRKVGTTESSIKFPDLGNLQNSELVVYTDASHGNLPDGVGSTGGFIVFLKGENDRCCPLYWESKRIRRVVRSTIAAETLAATEGIDMAIYLSNILSQIIYNGKPNCIPVTLYVDNKSLFENVHSTKNVSEKRLRIDIAVMKELVDEKKLKIKWVESKNQIADVLTKKGVNGCKILNVLELGSFTT